MSKNWNGWGWNELTAPTISYFKTQLKTKPLISIVKIFKVFIFVGKSVVL